MFLSFRAVAVVIALTAAVSAAEDQKAADPKDNAELQAMMKMMQESLMSLTGEKHLDENTRNVIKQLTIFPLEKLYMLKMSDTCEVAGFTCGSFKADKVIPLID